MHNISRERGKPLSHAFMLRVVCDTIVIVCSCCKVKMGICYCRRLLVTQRLFFSSLAITYAYSTIMIVNRLWTEGFLPHKLCGSNSLPSCSFDMVWPFQYQWHQKQKHASSSDLSIAMQTYSCCKTRLQRRWRKACSFKSSLWKLSPWVWQDFFSACCDTVYWRVAWNLVCFDTCRW